MCEDEKYLYSTFDPFALLLKPVVFAEKPQALIQNNVQINQKEENEILNEWRQRLGAAPEPQGTPSSGSAPQSQ
ncbi:MAG: hypothetical protein R6U56_09310 [Opitutales bacterium]